MKHMVTLDYKLMLSLSLWQYNHHPDEGLTSGLFQKLSDRLTESTITKNGPDISTGTSGI